MCHVYLFLVEFTLSVSTIIPQALVDNLHPAGQAPSLRNWILDVLTNRPQTVRIHNISSSPVIP